MLLYKFYLYPDIESLITLCDSAYFVYAQSKLAGPDRAAVVARSAAGGGGRHPPVPPRRGRAIGTSGRQARRSHRRAGAPRRAARHSSTKTTRRSRARPAGYRRADAGKLPLNNYKRS